MCMLEPADVRRGHQILIAGVTSDCEMPNKAAKNWTWVLKRGICALNHRAISQAQQLDFFLFDESEFFTCMYVHLPRHGWKILTEARKWYQNGTEVTDACAEKIGAGNCTLVLFKNIRCYYPMSHLFKPGAIFITDLCPAELSSLWLYHSISPTWMVLVLLSTSQARFPNESKLKGMWAWWRRKSQGCIGASSLETAHGYT